jgi:hypothetical protein
LHHTPAWDPTLSVVTYSRFAKNCPVTVGDGQSRVSRRTLSARACALHFRFVAVHCDAVCMVAALNARPLAARRVAAVTRSVAVAAQSASVSVDTSARAPHLGKQQKLDLSPVPPMRHAADGDDVVLTSSIPSSTHPTPLAREARDSGSFVSGSMEDTDPVGPSAGSGSGYGSGAASKSRGSVREDDDMLHDPDVATARPSHRRLAGYQPSAQVGEALQGHRIEVFVRVR